MVKRFALITVLLFASDEIRAIPPPQQATIVDFSPRGTVKKVRQVRVRFSEPMIAFGDPQAQSPFRVDPPEEGSGRWIDPHNWAYDFKRDLPAGVRCRFQVRDDLRTLSGKAFTGERLFQFSTGGPAISRSQPYEGSWVSEDQIFILELDGTVDEPSALESVYFTTEELSERIGIRIVQGTQRDQILQSQYRYRNKPSDRLLLIQAKQRFVPEATVSLVWGRGVRSESQVVTAGDQVLPFRVRADFAATFYCEKENAEADCVPVSPMNLRFSAPVAWSKAQNVTLTGEKGRSWSPSKPGRLDPESFVHRLVFEGPFPEQSRFVITLPEEIQDDAGRSLKNAASFPLSVYTDDYPPLAKFASRFGILELKASPVLPVTLRNIEREVPGRRIDIQQNEEDPTGQGDKKPVKGKVKGKMIRVSSERVLAIKRWLMKVDRRRWDDRGSSIFEATTLASSFSVPKSQGSKPMEVVGIPFRSPGFYVLELESQILGSALLGPSPPKSMFVPTTVLVTNLSVHFKRGVESSLVWVTTLDKAKPVGEASVQIFDCGGQELWSGKTDREGMARIALLPTRNRIADCSQENNAVYHQLNRGLFVTAQRKDDFAFVHTSWEKGIEPWRFGLPTEWRTRLQTAHAVLDRGLYRAGETVHMKVWLRQELTRGFSKVADQEKYQRLEIRHGGTRQKFQLPLRWRADGTAAARWQIPKEAKLGYYQIYLENAAESLAAGRFRVEEYRVPLMRGSIRTPAVPLVAPDRINLDIAVRYLAGGGATRLPVKFRHHFQPRPLPRFESFEGFTFSNGSVEEGIVRRSSSSQGQPRFQLQSAAMTLDSAGTTRATVSNPSGAERPMSLLTEVEFRDPNGEVQTVSSRIPVWPTDHLIGLKPDSWALSREAIKLKVAVVNLQGQPIRGAAVTVDLFERKTYSHRKRLVGGFYSYDHLTETRRIGAFCTGTTNHQGILACDAAAPVSGNLLLQAATTDTEGRTSVTHHSVWIAGEEDWWFSIDDGDRIDLLPEKKRYEPGEVAKFQVRMPFRSARALVTVEREGIATAWVQTLSRKKPVIEVPIRGNYAPNAFVSVLVVRGREGRVRPTATVDLGRPAYKLGVAEIFVGWKAHELKVSVHSDREVYKVREMATVDIRVRTPDGKAPSNDCRVTVAAVDEGLLELLPNRSWSLLETMMRRRRYAVRTSTAQTHIVGKRHFGLKALPTGGGGGKHTTRELFDTLVLWKADVPVDREGNTTIEIPMNDSLSSFRLVAVASSGLHRFGTGETSVRTTQDLMIFSGVPPLVREGDRFRSEFTVRNTTDRTMQVRITGRVAELEEPLLPRELTLASGEAHVVGWSLVAPTDTRSLHYEITAASPDGAQDRLVVDQSVVAAVPTRIFQATLAQLQRPLSVPVRQPRSALPGRGGISVLLRPTLTGGMEGIREYMTRYPYGCLEQQISRSIALSERKYWDSIMKQLPSYIDRDGFAKYFPSMSLGSDVLTSYLMSISNEVGWPIPDLLRSRMAAALEDFIEGRALRYGALPTADLSIRKVAAVEALSREGRATANLLDTIAIEPNLWPTSAVIDWFNILQRVSAIPNRDSLVERADQILRSRLNFQGTTMGFSTERSDYLWWLMVSGDVNSVRFLLSVLGESGWREDVPRLVRGTLGRQKRGRWDTTVANAWGVLAIAKFSRVFENTPLRGSVSARLGDKSETIQWQLTPDGKDLHFPWPSGPDQLRAERIGTGRPWITVQSRAAIPLTEPISSGYTITKKVTSVERTRAGGWSVGDIVRVRLELEAQADMTWVVVTDPIPAGSAVLGTGFGRDSILARKGEQHRGWLTPIFEERGFESYRAYYEYVPKGRWTIEYTYRVNNEGRFAIPPTRVEAMYSPEMFGEIPNQPIRIGSMKQSPEEIGQ